MGPPSVEAAAPPGKVSAYVRALRPHQWLKNALIFVPLVAAHRLTDTLALEKAALAFLAFCCAASAGYIVNDLLDVEADRRHHRRRLRPFASGAASIPGGILLTAVVLAVAVAVGLALSPVFLLTLLLYLAGTIGYSVWLKRKAVVDVLMLAGLYTLRILAGSAATGIPASFWLLALSMFLFLDLACVKRYVELNSVNLEDGARVPGRGYGAIDRETLFTIGSGSGLVAVLILALYLNNPLTVGLYPTPEILWGLCPLFLYWTTRIWILARRGVVHDDPLVFAVTDRMSLVTVALMVVLLWLGASDSIVQRLLPSG